MIFKLGIKHQEEEFYKLYINHDPKLTLTLDEERKNCQNVIRRETCRKRANGLKIYDSEKIWTPGAGVPPTRGSILVYNHNIQTSSSLKPLEQSKPNFV